MGQERQTRGEARKEYDLGERTARFAESIVTFARSIPRTPVTVRLIGQLVAVGTSPGANYCEADEAVSRKDFRYRIAVCKKESREAKYWLRIIVSAAPDLRDSAKPLWQEAKELHLIFAAIYRNSAEEA